MISCCGIVLPTLEAEETNENHRIYYERIENELYVSIQHPLSKDHFISFIAYLTYDRCEIVKLYPEQNGEVRFLCLFQKNISLKQEH